MRFNNTHDLLGQPFDPKAIQLTSKSERAIWWGVHVFLTGHRPDMGSSQIGPRTIEPWTVGPWTTGPPTVAPQGPICHFFRADSWAPDNYHYHNNGMIVMIMKMIITMKSMMIMTLRRGADLESACRSSASPPAPSQSVTPLTQD